LLSEARLPLEVTDDVVRHIICSKRVFLNTALLFFSALVLCVSPGVAAEAAKPASGAKAKAVNENKAATTEQREVARLSGDQIKQFARMVRIRDLRRGELVVLTRIREEKRREVKAFVDEMDKEFGMSPESAYTYEIKDKTLYRLSTNRLDKAGNPERKVVRKVKSDSESQYHATVRGIRWTI
jgi:hypothetical protein